MHLLFLAVDPSATPSPSPAAAEGPSWTDQWSAVGTVGATLFALAAIVVTIVMARQDRKKATRLRREDSEEADRRRQEDLQRAADQRAEDLARAAQDRAEADQRLREERDAADQRLAQERADWDRRQVRDWQAAAATALLHRIAEVQPHLPHLAFRVVRRGEVGNIEEMKNAAVHNLQQGAYTDALALGNETGTELYRSLVALVVSAPGVLTEVMAGPGTTSRAAASEAIGADLRRYCRYVRLRLCQLIETGSIPPEPTGNVPSLRLAATGAGVAGRHRALWTPSEQPPGWDEDVSTDPDDPQFTLRP